MGYSPRGCNESDTTERLHFHFSLSCVGGGNGNPLQCSCLENPRDGGAWWAAIYGVTQGWIRLKRLSSSSCSSTAKESACTAGDPQFDSWVRKIPWRRDWLPTPVFLDFPGGSDGKESSCNLGDLGSNPGLGRFPGEGKGYLHQYSGLENPHGQRNLVGCSPWGFKESDTTERASTNALCLCT